MLRDFVNVAAFAGLALAAKPCNTDNAVAQSTYQATFTYQGTTMTVSGNNVWTSPTSSSSSSSSDEDSMEFETNTENTSMWGDLGEDAVNDLGYRKRDVEEDFECGSSSDTCVVNAGMMPFCVSEPSGDWYGADGAVGNVVSGNYVVDGESGNVYSGPCPGDQYQWNAEETYCEIVAVAAEVDEDASSSGDGSSSTATSETNDSSGTESGSASDGEASGNAASGMGAVTAAALSVVFAVCANL